MNQFGMSVLWVAVQTTLLATAAAACYLVAARRGPGAAARVAAGFLAALAALPLLAVCPLPSWPAWDSHQATPAQQRADLPAPDASGPIAILPGVDEPSSAGGVDLTAAFASLRRTWHDLGRSRVAAGQRQANWPAVLALIFLTGVGLGLLRLLLGMWLLCRWCRRGCRVDDPALHDLLGELREGMHGPAEVELRELADLTAPATVGWLRPVILLPADWRGWDEAERRAVLAHEWAHVCCRDYLAALVARVGVALHFYHPLVYWLAGRLLLQQELEADAHGARCAGGCGPYLRALAQLALRQDGRPLAWPAKAFLSRTGMLKRRISMLRSNLVVPGPQVSRSRRALTLALLVVTALGVATLRSPAQRDADPQATPAAPVQSAEQVPPFDLSYLQPESMGAVCLRPAILLGRPELRPALDVINFGFDLFSRGPGLPDSLHIRLEDIEQVVLSPRIETEKNKKKGPQSQFLLGLTMVRTVKDFDWMAHVKKLAPDAEEVAYAGKAYLKLPRSPILFQIANSKAAFCCYVPDARSLVFATEPNLRRIIDGKQGSPRRSWAADWKRVEHSAIAVALDMQDKSWFADRRQPEEGLDETEMLILKNTASTAFGIAVADKITIDTLVRCVDTNKARQLMQAVERQLAKGREGLEEEQKKGKAGGFELQWLNFERDLLGNARATPEGALIRWHAEARLDFAEMARYLQSGMETLQGMERKMKTETDKQ
jgi:beta-lactamase regulating signal transducer with metallopeptidase domain